MKVRQHVITFVAYAVWAWSAPLHAEDLAVTTTVYCQDGGVSQVFEACEEVQLLEKVGPRVRAYSVPKKQVLSLKPETIFVARLAATSEKMSVGEKITISSNRVWNSSSPGFLGICTINEILKQDVLKVSCGRYRNEKISRNSIYVLKPYNFTEQKSEFRLKSSTVN